jgi:hypothetical protein
LLLLPKPDAAALQAVTAVADHLRQPLMAPPIIWRIQLPPLLLLLAVG